jgi:hypothetical protein
MRTSPRTQKLHRREHRATIQVGFTIGTVARSYSITIQIQLIITNNTPATKILLFVDEKLEKQTTSRAPNVTPTKAIARTYFPVIRDITFPYPHPRVTTRARSCSIQISTHTCIQRPSPRPRSEYRALTVVGALVLQSRGLVATHGTLR